MKILLLGAGFHPEITAIAPFNTELCEYLVAKGHSVTMVCAFPHYPEWKVRKEYRGKFLNFEKYNGVNVIRVWNYVPSKPKTIKRIFYDSSIGISLFLGAFFVKRTHIPDIVMSVCSPLQVGYSGWLTAIIYRAPFFFHIQDLIPESAISTDMLKNKYAIGLAGKMATFIYKKASYISVIGHSFKSSIVNMGINKEKINYLPNWVDTDWIKPKKKSIALSEELGIDSNKFTVMYIGNIGKKQDIFSLVEVAYKLKFNQDIQIIIFGDGNSKKEVEKLISNKGLKNIQLFGIQPRKNLPDMLSLADVLIITQKRDVINMVVPSKLLTYAASGKPIIFSGHFESEGACFIKNSKSGVIVEPENPDALVKEIRYMKKNVILKNDFSKNARSYAEKNFSKDIVLKKFETAFYNTIK